MPSHIDPLTVIAEILGEPATAMRNPANAKYRCPFINSQCIKRSQKLAGSYPVCTIFHGKQKDAPPKVMCVCPKRLYQIDLLRDVLNNCWPGVPPVNPRIAYEVKMGDVGNVDFVVADVASDGKTIRDFVSVEVQAVDITGSVEPAYRAITMNSRLITEPMTYGINWANVRKRYVTQLITKGFYHHHWKSRIVAVLQKSTYDSFKAYIDFDELPPRTAGNSINFLLYEYVRDVATGELSLKLEKVVGTSHNSLMMASMYRPIPNREDFCNRIVSRMK